MHIWESVKTQGENNMYDVYTKEFNTEWNIGDKVYCYYVDTGFLWRKKQ